MNMGLRARCRTAPEARFRPTAGAESTLRRTPYQGSKLEMASSTSAANDLCLLRARQRQRRRSRPLSSLAAVPEERTSAAMNGEQAAQELMDDLLALVEAGLVEPVRSGA